MNIAKRFEQTAKKLGDKSAVVIDATWMKPRRELSFTVLQERVERLCAYLRARGARRGDKVVVFIKPGEHLAAVTFALFRTGLVPVFIDPGMGKKALFNCLTQAEARLLIAESIVHLVRFFKTAPFKSIEIALSPKDLMRAYQTTPTTSTDVEDTRPDELAALLFTSGGTGAPKPVPYDHQLFDTQTTLLQELFGLTANESDFPGFPLFSLFTLCMGMSSVVPRFNAAQPSKANPKTLVEQILRERPSFVAGSPAIWSRVADYCEIHKITLPSVKWVVMFGAPVSLKIHRQFQSILPNGNTFTPYGATEALPISLIDGRTILSEHAGRMEKGVGWAVGKPVPGVRVRIIPITDEPLATITEAPALPAGELGEIVVNGPMVTKSYHQLPQATALSKINDPEYGVWHRMGDLGFLDDRGELWFAGRKTHRVQTAHGLLTSIQCEAIFNTHPSIKRSALVGLREAGTQKPALIIELNEQAKGVDKQQLQRELAERAAQYPHTQTIQTYFIAKSFPVDGRHHIKIDRLKLRDQAERGELS